MATPEPAEVLRRVMESRLLDLHTALPAQIEVYDATEQTVDVQPMIKNVVSDPDGSELEEDFPVIPAVPVVFPRGGGHFITFPLAKGDFVLLVFCEKSIDQFMAKGKSAHPVDLEKHGFSGAVAMAGFYPTAQALAEDGHDTGLLMGKESAGPQIYISDTKIELGQKDASDAVSLDSAVQTQLTNIVNDINALRTAFSNWTVAPQDGGAALKAATTSWIGASLTVGTTASALVTIKE